MLLFGDVSLETDTDSDGMAGYYLNTGINNPRCEEAPENGMLIQSPSGVGEVRMQMNGAELVIGSTVFLQAAPGGDMAIMMLEGEARLTANERSMTIPAGAWARIPMDANGNISGDPEMHVYTMDRVHNLPVHMMPEAIDIAPPMTDDEMTLWLSKPLAGQWTSELIEACPDTGQVRAFYTLSDVTAEGFSLQPEGREAGISYIMREPGVYINEFGAEWTVIAPDRIESRVVYSDGCVSLTELRLLP